MRRILITLVALLLAEAVFAINPYITPFTVSIEVGETTVLNTKLPAGTQVFWHATNPKVVEIVEQSMSHAKVKGITTGQTAVTYRTDTGRRASAMVYVGNAKDVNQPHFLVTAPRVVIAPQRQVVPVGENIDYFATLAKEKEFEWSIEDSNILKIVSAKGNRARIKALAPGMSQVFVKSKKGIIGNSLVKVIPAGRQRHSQGIKYFESGALQGWKPYARTGGVTVYKA